MYVLAAAALAIRLFNPHDSAVDATLHCGGELRAVRLAAHELRDVEGCAAVEALVPVVAIETSVDDDDREWQRLIAVDVKADAECGTAAMAVPLFACRNGVATAFVTPADGATYAWSAEGAVITGGASTNRVAVELGDAATARLTCVITTSECTQTATGAIGVREPIVVKSFTVPATANANQPLTISWSYEPGREPATQLLTGDLFAEPVQLAPAARSYTVTPQNGGMRNVELRASYAQAIYVTPPAKRRRRSVGGGVTATECPSATATARVDVKGCAIREPIVNAPEDVKAGEGFQVVLVDLVDGDKVQWSVDNGTIADASPFGERVLVVAGTSGKTEVHARVERSAGCFTNVAASVAIIQPANQCGGAATAALSLVSTNCNAAVVRASFTGTPPFAGRWSDGTQFRTPEMFAYHEFRAAGTYGMFDFHDSSCFGAVSGSPSVSTLKPAVKVEGVEGCAGGQVTATFTGTPPFSGTWSDGQPFTTSDATITRSVSVGPWSIQNLTDATCSTVKASSNIVTFAPRPRAWADPGPECYLDKAEGSGAIWVETAGGKPPYVWEWADGGMTTSMSSKTYRIVTIAGDAKTYELKRATAAGCEATLENRFVTMYKRQAGTISGGTRTYCTQTDITVASLWEPSTGAYLGWSLWGYGFKPANVKIVSGSGTPALTFRSNTAGNAYLYLETTFADATCQHRSPTQDITFADPVAISNVTVGPPSIPRWGTATISWTAAGTPIGLAVSPGPGRYGDIQVKGCCSALYVDTHGPGVVPITISWNDCTGQHEVQTSITITE
jgi:hypothetical protein